MKSRQRYAPAMWNVRPLSDTSVAGDCAPGGAVAGAAGKAVGRDGVTGSPKRTTSTILNAPPGSGVTAPVSGSTRLVASSAAVPSTRQREKPAVGLTPR